LLRDKWYTLSETSHVTITEKKSEFIADAAPIGSAAEAEAFLGDIRRKYPDARHHVYAWRLGGDEILQRYSDDGEPAGTAGLPVLECAEKESNR
jgi:putative IMPACT (imprinted ancient) family translation regulator